jgi:hypothetical protein
LTVTDNASPTTQSSALSGTGTAVLPPDFTINVSPGSQTVTPGGSALYTISLVSINGNYSGTVNLSVSGLPTGSTGTFNPASVTLGGEGSTTATLTIATINPLLAQNNQPHQSTRWPFAALALLILVPFNKRWRKALIGRALVLLASITFITFISGCGGGFAFQPPPQNYTITITAAGTVTHTTTVQLTVQ